MAKFEILDNYKNAGINLPVRATEHSAGYDFEAAEEVVIPSFWNLKGLMDQHFTEDMDTLKNVAKITEINNTRPRLIPTGITCKLADDEYLEIVARSSLPLKHWLVLANGVGIIDSDYYGNEIKFQYMNFSPCDIIIHKGDRIGQGIIHKYITTEDDMPGGKRTGGFGSSGQ